MTTEAQRQRWEGCGHEPRSTWSPQKAEEAETILPQSLRRERSLLTPASQTSGLQGAREYISAVLRPPPYGLLQQTQASSMDPNFLKPILQGRKLRSER